MDRSERDIIEKMKEYRGENVAIEAMAEMLLFMGIIDAPAMAQQAFDELAQERQAEKQLQREYAQHLKKGFGHYMSYNQFKAKKQAGEI